MKRELNLEKGKRVSEAIKYAMFASKKSSQKELAAYLKMHAVTLSKAKAGDAEYIDGVIDVLCEKFNVLNRDYLNNGDGNLLLLEEVRSVPESDYMMLEYADLRSNGGKLGGGDMTVLPDTRKRLIPREYENGKYLVVRVNGNSMYDGTARSLSDGDEILIRELENDEWENLPILTRLFVITSRDGNVVKQIKEVNKESGYIICNSFNKSFDDLKIYFSDIYQIFVVYKIVQKQISLL